eukprot:EG_transcript_3467
MPRVTGRAARCFSTAAAVDLEQLLGPMVVGKAFKPDPLRDSILPTNHFQRSLMRLPIPELDKTCARYLDAVSPLVTAEQFKETQRLVADFQGGQGKEVQEELKARDKENSHTSYISAWWFEEYLKSRSPLPINLNPYLVLRNDPNRRGQVERAAGLVYSALVFRQQLTSNKLLPEIFDLDPPAYTRKPVFRKLARLLPASRATPMWIALHKIQSFPLDMAQYPSLFGTTRVPGPGLDTLRSTQEALHIAVLCNDHVFKVPVLNADGSIVPEAQIAARLAAVLHSAGTPPTSPVPILTSAPRDDWASARAALEADPANAQALADVDGAILALCLDTEAEPFATDLRPLSRQMLHHGGRNRWFDKSISLIVRPDGVAAVNFEHSWGDGVAVLRFSEDVFNDSLQRPAPQSSENPTAPVQQLEWRLTPPVEQAINAARQRMEADAQRMQLHIMFCAGLGKKHIGKVGARADPFMQLAIQLAYWRLHRAVESVYESCSTSAFKHGRTECIRGATPESAAFVRAMDDAAVSAAEKAAMVHKALAKHAQLSKDAKMGQGVDRHLYALNRLGVEAGREHPLFKDAAYQALKADMLSTSSLYSDAIMLGGFGPVSPGYGVGYAASPDLSLFHITSWGRSTSDFCDAIQTALQDMVNLLKAVKKS